VTGTRRRRSKHLRMIWRKWEDTGNWARKQ